MSTGLRSLPMVMLLLLTVLLAGCLNLNAPQLHTDPDNDITLYRGQTKQLEVSAENNYTVPARFTVDIDAPDFVDVATIDGETVTGPVALGEAASDSNTNKKVLLLSLNEHRMQDEEWETATYDLVLELHTTPHRDGVVKKTMELHVRNRESGLF